MPRAVYTALGMPFSALVWPQAILFAGIGDYREKGKGMKIPSLRWLTPSAHKSAGSRSGDGR
jgi:hypothetical protein